MRIESLDLRNFRNYRELHLDFGDGIHIFYGDNAQGKSNLLEAVFLLASGRSFRNSKDREMIRFDEEECHLKGGFLKEDLKLRIDMHLKNAGNRGIALNGVKLRKTRELVGKVPCVLFSPEDLEIVKKGPSERRRFLDSEISLIDPIYLNDLSQYKKALEQRNQLLKDIAFEPSLKDMLDVWDEQLVRFGRNMTAVRRRFLSELSEDVSRIHRSISGDREDLRLFYEPDVSEEAFAEKLFRNRENDIRNRNTSCGPHRDDFEFRLTLSSGERPADARVYGSQGQQRTAALSLKLAEIEIVRRKTGETPLLLLDDVLSELDRNRQEYLIDSLEHIQTLITCTGLDDFVNHQDALRKVYHVANGEIVYGE
ncbi:MAG: DNA replication/repair protein RecF [Lachnospiraceae bacterium]|nr:DNA replication/repair protein RecF [Lachnospiraceae bacterium]